MTSDKQFVHRAFSAMANNSPSQIAIEEEHRRISYADLELVAARLAGFLASLGVRKEAITGVLLPSSVELVASLLAIFRSGGIYLPIDKHFPVKRMEQVFMVTAPDILIVHEDWLVEMLSFLQKHGLQRPGIIVPGDFSVANTVQWHAPDGSVTQINLDAYDPFTLDGLPSDANYIFYTSGSSGEAKPILGCHISLSHFIQWEIKEFQLGPQHKISQLTQITFDASLRDIFAALCAGATLCIPAEATRTNIPLLIQWLKRTKVSLVHCVPSLFRVITKTLQTSQANTAQFEALQYILLAGETLYAKDISEWRKVIGTGVEIVNLYGATETTLVKTFHRIREIPTDTTQPLHVGKPIDNTIVAIINDGSLCKIGEIGEVYIKTPFTTKGYYKNKALTNSVFVQNPLLSDKEDIVYKTGDLGRYLISRDIEILGRLDSQVKINGIRVELNEVEKAIMTLEGIGQVVVRVYKDAGNQQLLLAYYTGLEVDAGVMRDHLTTILQRHAIPAHFIWLEKFPLNLNGKIDRRALPLPETILQAVEYVAPEGEIESKLESIWKNILGLKRVSRNVSFFSIGGHSLRAIQLLSRIYSDLQVDLKVTDIFSNPTIAQQAKLVSKSATTRIHDIPLAAGHNHLYVVSHGQQRLWTLAQFGEGDNTFNMAGAYLLSGDLDRIAFENAFIQFIDRHEILRTTFVHDGTALKQQVHATDAFNFHIQYLDYSYKSYMETDPEITSLIDEEAKRAFDLASGPLVRCVLLRLAESRYVFVLTMHHIISDDWSMQILVREIAALYNAARNGTKPALPQLAIQYKDFSAWHNKLLSDGPGQQHREFWLQQLGDAPPPLKLPVDFQRPAVLTSNGDSMSFTISDLMAARLTDLARQQEATLFMVLLSAVSTLLYRKTGQRDLVIGSPMAGRTHKDLESLVGLFINPLPIRLRFPQASLFAELLTEVKAATLSVYNHQLYSLDLLSADLAMTRDFSRSMFFDVAVMLQNVAARHNSTNAFDGLQVAYLPSAVVSKHDLEFYFTEEGAVINATIIYNIDLYKEKTICGLRDEFMQIIEAITADPHYRLDGSDRAGLIAERTQSISRTF